MAFFIIPVRLCLALFGSIFVCWILGIHEVSEKCVINSVKLLQYIFFDFHLTAKAKFHDSRTHFFRCTFFCFVQPCICISDFLDLWYCFKWLNGLCNNRRVGVWCMHIGLSYFRYIECAIRIIIINFAQIISFLHSFPCVPYDCQIFIVQDRVR